MDLDDAENLKETQFPKTNQSAGKAFILSEFIEASKGVILQVY